MAINKTKINQAYSPDKPLQGLSQEVIVANRAPVSGSNYTTPKGDLATIGQIWCDQKNLNSYILTGYSSDPATKGQSVWTQIDNSGGGGSFSSLSVNPGPTALTGTVSFNINSPTGYLLQKTIINDGIEGNGEQIFRARTQAVDATADLQNNDYFYDKFYYGKSQNGTANVAALLDRLQLVSGAGTNTLNVRRLIYGYNAGIAELHYTFGPSGSFALNKSGGYLAVKGGAATDFIGSATLVAGTVTVANTNILANDNVFVTRSAVGGTPGFLSVSIAAGASFTITSTNAGDTSTVNYFIVRRI